MEIHQAPVSAEMATMAGLQLTRHDHLCVFYRGRSERDQLLISFLREGLRAGQTCLCLAARDEHKRLVASVGGRDGRDDGDAPDIEPERAPAVGSRDHVPR
ncbi:MAG: MEDS domain-containing protein, partial [Acidimicrobiia bacterium]